MELLKVNLPLEAQKQPIVDNYKTLVKFAGVHSRPGVAQSE